MIWVLFLCIRVLSIKLIIDNSKNYYYTITTGFGSPIQNLSLSISTSSQVIKKQFTWFDENTCKDCHESKKKFNPNESSTFITDSWKKVNFDFMNGVVSGIPSSDIQTISESLSLRVPFVLASTDVQGISIITFTPDGALGLCPSSGFLKSLFKSSEIPEEFFSLYFSDNDFSEKSTKIESQLLLGEVDMKLTQETEGILIQTKDCWEFQMTQVFYRDSLVSSGSFGYFDSSYYFLFGPKREVLNLLQVFIGTHNCRQGIEGFYICTCMNFDDYSDLIFSINNEHLILPPSKYFLKVGERCYLLLQYSEQVNNQFWRLGLPLFREYYSIFNQSSSSIQFFRAKPSEVQSNDEYSIKRWVTITITITVLILSFISLFIIYSIFCKPPSRWVSV